MDALLRRFPGLAGLPRIDLGVRPTPVDRLRIDGLDFLVKRDDRVGGNKVRCLELLLAPLPQRVLTVSSLSAHHAYATAYHARRLGVPCACILVRRGRRGPAYDALEGTGARVVEVGGGSGAVWAAALLWRPGTRIILPGGMSPLGAVGYCAAALELATVPERIYVPLGTGTTVSGLLAGLMLREACTEVVGVRVADAAPGWKPLLWNRAFRAVRLLRRHDPSVPEPRRGDVRLRVVKAEGAYGEPTPAAERAVAAAAEAGLHLEPTYTGKTLAVLVAERPEGALFVNTYAPPTSLHGGPD